MRREAAAGGAGGDVRRPTIAEVNALPLAEVAELLRPVAELSEAGPPSTARGDDRGRGPDRPTWSRGSRSCSTSASATSASGALDDAVAGRGAAPADRHPAALGLFGVVYVLDEPSAGLHPADAEPLLDVLDRLKASGNSLFVVEHDMDVVRRADWVVDIGPGAGEGGGRVLYSGPVAGLEAGRGVGHQPVPLRPAEPPTHPATPHGWLHLHGVTAQPA